MKILNFTGKPIGLTTEGGTPVTILSSDGNAKCDTLKVKKKTVDLVPIYQKRYSHITGLPKPDSSYNTYYIVNKEVAEAVGDTRFDLLVPEDPMEWDGAVYYKSLINI